MAEVPRATRTVAQKMGLKEGGRAHVVGAPPGVVDALGLPPLRWAPRLEGPLDYLHLFAVTRADLHHGLQRCEPHLAPTGKLWVSWPKGGRLGSDLALPAVIETAYDAGLVESTCLRVDDTWAGLRLTRPQQGKTYANSYGTLPHQR